MHVQHIDANSWFLDPDPTRSVATTLSLGLSDIHMLEAQQVHPLYRSQFLDALKSYADVGTTLISGQRWTFMSWLKEFPWRTGISVYQASARLPVHLDPTSALR